MPNIPVIDVINGENNIKVKYVKIIINLLDIKKEQFNIISALLIIMKKMKLGVKSVLVIIDYILKRKPNPIFFNKTQSLIKSLSSYIQENGIEEDIKYQIYEDVMWIHMRYNKNNSNCDYENKLIKELSISQDKKIETINGLLDLNYKILNASLNDKTIEELFKKLSATASAAGVPLTAVYYGGSVVGFSAAGITSGLAALGFGLGMVGGIGAVIGIGLLTFKAVNTILDTIFKSNNKSILVKKIEVICKENEVVIKWIKEELKTPIKNQEKQKILDDCIKELKGYNDNLNKLI